MNKIQPRYNNKKKTFIWEFSFKGLFFLQNYEIAQEKKPPIKIAHLYSYLFSPR